eukprot:m.164516 g.164516  ORF g.164516 m.164516 type:complete len:73 (-) comp14400_c0_seq20:222-440(-)
MVVDAVLSWANGPSLVEGILPSYSSDDPFCQTQWDCLDRSRVYLISIAIHLYVRVALVVEVNAHVCVCMAHW